MMTSHRIEFKFFCNVIELIMIFEDSKEEGNGSRYQNPRYYRKQWKSYANLTNCGTQT